MERAAHYETALTHVQRIVSLVAGPNAPITPWEAIEQVTEELELAGFACLDPPRGTRAVQAPAAGDTAQPTHACGEPQA
jgi:hypothetical protein